MTEEEFRSRVAARGLPANGVDMAVGEFAPVDPMLGRLLGRRPTSVRDVLRATLAR